MPNTPGTASKDALVILFLLILTQFHELNFFTLRDYIQVRPGLIYWITDLDKESRQHGQFEAVLIVDVLPIHDHQHRQRAQAQSQKQLQAFRGRSRGVVPEFGHRTIQSKAATMRRNPATPTQPGGDVWHHGPTPRTTRPIVPWEPMIMMKGMGWTHSFGPSDDTPTSGGHPRGRDTAHATPRPHTPHGGWNGRWTRLLMEFTGTHSTEEGGEMDWWITVRKTTSSKIRDVWVRRK